MIRTEKFNPKQPMVADRAFMCYSAGDLIKPTTFSRLRKWFRHGWVRLAKPADLKRLEQGPDKVAPEPDQVPIPDEHAPDVDGSEPVPLKVIEGHRGWFTVEMSDGSLIKVRRRDVEEMDLDIPEDLE